MMLNKNHTFTFTWSILFFLSYYLLRAILGDDEYGIHVAAFVSVLVTPLWTYLLLFHQRKILGTFLTTIYFLVLIFSLFFLKIKLDPIEYIQGRWTTQEKDGENFSLEFLKGDSLKIAIPLEVEKTYNFKLDGNRVMVLDEEGDVVLVWELILKDQQLILLKENEQLVFYKNHH